MSNYSDNFSSFRVDFFNSAGKWYTTEAVIWDDYTGPFFDSFARALAKHLPRDSNGNRRLSGMTAVCIDSYLKPRNPHPPGGIKVGIGYDNDDQAQKKSLDEVK